MKSGDEGVHIANGKDAAFHAIGDEVGLTADIVRDDDGAACVHDFIHDKAPGLMARGKNEDIAEIEEARQLGLIAKAAEAHAVCPGCGDHALEVGSVLRHRRR